ARGLAGRGLTLAGRQHIAHEDFLDLLRCEFGALERRADHMRSELVGAERREFAQEAAKRRAGCGEDDDGIGGCGHGGTPWSFESKSHDMHHMMRRKKCNAACS